jgi:hypothetical protein
MDKEEENAINDRLQYRFTVFLEFAKVDQLNKNLRRLLMVYLKHELKDGVDLFFHELVRELYYLFDLLDSIDEALPSNGEENET